AVAVSCGSTLTSLTRDHCRYGDHMSGLVVPRKTEPSHTDPSMSALSVAWHDPYRAEAPPGWSEFITAHKLHPLWDWSIVSTYARVSRVMVITATIHDDHGVKALITGRFPGIRLRRAGRPLTGVVDVDCLASSALPGIALSDPDDLELLAEVVTALRIALRQRFGQRLRGLMFRQIGAEWLPALLRRPAVVRQGGPIAVFHNRFSDFDEYLKSLGRKRRQSIQSITRRLEADPDLRVGSTLW